MCKRKEPGSQLFPFGSHSVSWDLLASVSFGGSFQGKLPVSFLLSFSQMQHCRFNSRTSVWQLLLDSCTLAWKAACLAPGDSGLTSSTGVGHLALMGHLNCPPCDSWSSRPGVPSRGCWCLPQGESEHPILRGEEGTLLTSFLSGYWQLSFGYLSRKNLGNPGKCMALSESYFKP